MNALIDVPKRFTNWFCFCVQMYADEKERPDSIWLPPCTDLMINKKVEGQAQQVLETGMEGGIYLRMSKGSILASRFCK
jgi:hypothetical protein